MKLIYELINALFTPIKQVHYILLKQVLIKTLFCITTVRIIKTKFNSTRNARLCNKRDDLLHLSFTLKISIFSVAYI